MALVDGFPDENSLTTSQREVLAKLTAAGFLSVDPEWTERVNVIRNKGLHAENAQVANTDVERQLRTIEVQLKHAAEKRNKVSLLKSKMEKWEDTNRHQVLETKRQDLLRERHQLLESINDLEAAKDAFETDLRNVPTLAKARYLEKNVVRVTNDGAFLVATLKQMNREHFKGRTLKDILNIGPLLA